MAKKIVISFLSQPITSGYGWSYAIESNGILLPYNSGVNQNTIQFKPLGSTQTITDIPIGVDLAQTLVKTLAHLRAYYVNSVIDYTIVNNTIEAVVNADVIINVSTSINASIVITQSEIEPNFINLKYYLIFDDYRLDILQKNYLGVASEIFGDITINKGSVSTILEPIRGTGLNLSLEANSVITFDEFGLADEFTYKTQLKKGNVIIFNGYIKPDGIQQSWVNEQWFVNIESVDGLGLLKDLSFVQSNGLPFIGKLSMYDVIKGCLDRTGLIMTINTSINIEYNGYAGANILKDVYVNSDRFVKAEKDNIIMDCNEVLTSILNLFSAVITQQDGQWYIYRPNDLVLNGYANFINQNTNTTFTKNLTNVLGSQIDNYYPHHCDSNQQIEMKGAISAYRLNYEYGFLDGILNNSKLVHNSSFNYAGFTVLDTTNLILDPLSKSGISFKDTVFLNSDVAIKSDNYTVIEGSLFSLKLNVDLLKSDGNPGGKYFKCIIKCGSYTLKYKPANNETSIDDASNAVWVLGSERYVLTLFGKSNINVKLPIIPVDGNLSIEIIGFTPWLTSSGLSTISFIDFIPQGQNDGRVGEFHTVSRKNPPSSITKENQKVFNGDGNITLVGSIYKSDQITLTNLWSRKNKFESYRLLQISAEDDLRIQSNPIKVFSGGIYGQIPYLSIININNVFGLFMFIEWSYNLKSNKMTAKMLQFYNSDLGDIEYDFIFDYGNNTIRPTIKG